jgi:alpha-ribazole phosphatase
MSVPPVLPFLAQARLILVRHGESVLGASHRYAGHRDTPLTSRGRAQALSLRPRLEKLRPDFIFSSDLQRCRQTAALMAPDRAIRTSPHLRELDFGAWDGMTADACLRRDPGRFDRWMKNPWRCRPPGGESLAQLSKRVRGFVAAVVREFPNRNLAIITHGGPLRVLLASRRSEFWKADVPPGAFFNLVGVAGLGRRNSIG